MEGLHDWHEFYLMLGSSAAALVALLFVAISIGVGFYTHRNTAGTRTFTSPVIVHFSAVLFISAMALAPTHGVVTLFALIGAGVVGAGVAIVTTSHIFDFMGDGMVEAIDNYAYGLIPLAAYVGVIASGILLFNHWEWAPELLAASVLTQLLVNIRNAWDLMLSVVRRQSGIEKRQRANRASSR
ncbi:MAG: hypothetical protein JOZ70_05810 [Pseudolabrys sp.]|nr:hypothetical protein [Pseudolabrys sp.]